MPFSDRTVLGSLLLAAAQVACSSGRSSPPSTVAHGDASDVYDSSDASDAGDAAHACPQLDITLTSSEAPVGGEVEVSVSISPASQSPPSYTWTATDGEFLSSILPSTRFSCSEVGPAILTVQVATPGCVETSSATVECEAFVQDAGALNGACTFPGQVGCVPCSGSPGGICTPTEIAFIQQDMTGGCYACLLAAGCLDSPDAGISGNECDDLMGDAVTGPSAGAWKPSLCSSTISCILGSSCAAPLVTDCYCGSAVGAACLIPGAANGACLMDESAGLETTDPHATVGATFTSKSLAAGVANAIFACAAGAHCSSCLGGSGGDAGGAATGDAAVNDGARPDAALDDAPVGLEAGFSD
jgi:hypothetical protein